MTPPSVSIVGSFRQHYAEVIRVANLFAMAGIAVNSPPISRIINPGEEYARFESDPPLSPDSQIQSAALGRIFSSDFVYVVNPCGYIGRTTAYELGRIHERGMAVYFSEPPLDLPIEVQSGTVLGCQDLIAVVAGRGNVQSKAARRPRVAALPTADLVILTVRNHQLNVLLVVRGKDPYRGRLALPGGFIRPGESLEDAARRELGEETGLDGALLPLEQVHTYSTPGRDPRGRVITTAFLAIAPDLPDPVADTDAARADWIEIEDSLGSRLAFDHGNILAQALERARRLLEYTTVAAKFCGTTFTVSDLRKVYEAVWGFPIDARNFNRKMHSVDGFLVKTGARRVRQQGRPAELYAQGPARILYPPFLRPAQDRAANGRAAPTT